MIQQIPMCEECRTTENMQMTWALKKDNVIGQDWYCHVCHPEKHRTLKQLRNEGKD